MTVEGTALRTVPLAPVSLITVREFDRYVRADGEPLLIRGWTADWRAVSAWDFDFFGSRYGSDMIAVTHDGGRLETTLADYLAYHRDRGADSALGRLERELGRSRPFYCLSYKPFRDHPELWDDLSLPPFVADWFPCLPAEFRAKHFPQHQGWVFIGGSGSAGPLHQDSHHTITWFAQVCGRKKFYLYAPDDAEGVYGGAVDAVEPDLVTHPRFCDVVGRECVLGPGEMLFLPPDWWHQAVALDESITVSCNFVNHTNFGDYLRAAFGSRLPELLATLPADVSPAR